MAGYQGIKGNEKADKEAKKTAKGFNYRQAFPPTIPVPSSANQSISHKPTTLSHTQERMDQHMVQL